MDVPLVNSIIRSIYHHRRRRRRRRHHHHHRYYRYRSRYNYRSLPRPRNRSRSRFRYYGITTSAVNIPPLENKIRIPAGPCNILFFIAVCGVLL